MRSDAVADEYKFEGISTRNGDYDDPDSLIAALEGVDRLLLISSSEVGKRAVQHANVIHAAKTAGVSFIAYTSLLNVDTGEMALGEEHKATEAAVRASGIPYTFLRNGWYSENIAGVAPQSIAMGQHFGAAGEGRLSTASRDDYAQAAAVVLAGQGHEGHVYELGGDTSFTLAEFAELLKELSGKEIIYVDLPETAFKDALVGAGLPEGFAAILADSDVKAAKGALETKSDDLKKLIGRPTTPMRETLALFIG